MYHYVQEYNQKLPELSFLHIKDFRRQLDYFSQKYEFLSREDWELMTTVGKIPKLENKILLTFDDGLKGHFDYVYEELKKRGLWGIFFVCSHPLKQITLLEVHKIHILMAINRPFEIYKYLTAHYDNNVLYKNYDNSDFRLTSYQTQVNHELVTKLKRILNYYVDETFRETLINDLLDNFVETDWAVDFYLSKENIIEMSQNGMVIGNHTHSHKLLSKNKYLDQEVQINVPQRYLNKMGISSDVFCYPYGGKRSYNNDTLNILEDLQVKFAFSVGQRDVVPDDLVNRAKQLTLPRYDCNLFKFGQRWCE